jgi:uncharacterized membrane protein
VESARPLLVSLIVALACLLLLAGPPTAIALLVLMPTLLYGPGLLVLWLVDPTDERLPNLERAFLAPPLSIAALVPVLLLVAVLSDGLTRPALVAAIVSECSLLGIVAAWRAWSRRGGKGEGMLASRLPDDRHEHWGWLVNVPRRPFWLLGAGLLLPAIGVGAAVIWGGLQGGSPRSGFTEFYVVDGRTGQAVFPGTLRVGQALDLQVGIINREGEPRSYLVQARLNGTLVQLLGPVTVQDREVREIPLRISPPSGGRQLLELILYVQPSASGLAAHSPAAPQEPTPYRQLHLWIEQSTTR